MKKMKRKPVIEKYFQALGIIIVLLLLVSNVNIAVMVQANEESDFEIKNKNFDTYVQENIHLTRFHALFLEIALPHIKNHEIKHIIQEIIIRTKNTGEVNGRDIQEIIKKSNADITGVYGQTRYLLTGIKTAAKTDGGVYLFPGTVLTLLSFFSICPYVCYKPTNSVQERFGWHLEINGERVERGPGHIFGYIGHAFNSVSGSEPDTNWFFTLYGFGFLIIHTPEDDF